MAYDPLGDMLPSTKKRKQDEMDTLEYGNLNMAPPTTQAIAQKGSTSTNNTSAVSPASGQGIVHSEATMAGNDWSGYNPATTTNAAPNIVTPQPGAAFGDEFRYAGTDVSATGKASAMDTPPTEYSLDGDSKATSWSPLGPNAETKTVTAGPGDVELNLLPKGWPREPVWPFENLLKGLHGSRGSVGWESPDDKKPTETPADKPKPAVVTARDDAKNMGFEPSNLVTLPDGTTYLNKQGMLQLSNRLQMGMEQMAKSGDASSLAKLVNVEVQLPPGYNMTRDSEGMPIIDYDAQGAKEERVIDGTRTEVYKYPRLTLQEELMVNRTLQMQEEAQRLVAESAEKQLGLKIRKEELALQSAEFVKEMELAMSKHTLDEKAFASNEAFQQSQISGLFTDKDGNEQPTITKQDLMQKWEMDEASLALQEREMALREAGASGTFYDGEVPQDTVEMQRLKAEVLGKFGDADTLSREEFEATMTGFMEGKPTFAREQFLAQKKIAQSDFLNNIGQQLIGDIRDDKGELTELGRELQAQGIDVTGNIAVIESLEAKRQTMEQDLMAAKATGSMVTTVYEEQKDADGNVVLDGNGQPVLMAVTKSVDTIEQQILDNQETQAAHLRKMDLDRQAIARSANVRAGEQQTFAQKLAKDRLSMERTTAGEQIAVSREQIDEAQRAAMAGEVTARQAITEQTERLAMELQAQAAQQGQQLSAEQAMQQAQLQVQQQMQQTAGQQTIAQQTLQGQQAIAQQQLGGQQQLAAIGAQGTQDRQQLAMQIQAQAQQQGQQITAEAALAEADRQLQSQMQTTAGTQAIEQIQAQAQAQAGLVEQARGGLEELELQRGQVRQYTGNLQRALSRASVDNLGGLEAAINQTLPPVPAGMVWDTASGALKLRAGFEGRDIDPQTQRAMEQVAPALRARDRAERVLGQMQSAKLEQDMARRTQADADRRLKDALADGDITTAEEAAILKSGAETDLLEAQALNQQFAMALQLVAAGPTALGLASRVGLLQQIQEATGITIPHVPTAPLDGASIPNYNDWMNMPLEEKGLRRTLYTEATGQPGEELDRMIGQTGMGQIYAPKYATL